VSRSATQAILLWLFVINLGIAFGAGLYEHRIALRHAIVLPAWLMSLRAFSLFYQRP